MGEIVRSGLARRLAVGAATLALATIGSDVGLGAAAGTAPASLTGEAAGVDYTCTDALGMAWPLHLDALEPLTVPAGGLVSGLTISTGLAPLVAQLTGALLAPLFTLSDLTFVLASGLDVVAHFDVGGGLDFSPFSLPASSVPGSTVPITAPHTFVFTILGTTVGSLACTIDDTGSDVLGTILVGPASTDTGTHHADPPPYDSGSGGAPASAGSGGDAGGATPPARLRAWLVHRTVPVGRHARVRTVVATGDGIPAHGRVVVRGAGRRLGAARLVDGAAAVRLPSLAPGRYRLRVRVAALARRLTLRVTR